MLHVAPRVSSFHHFRRWVRHCWLHVQDTSTTDNPPIYSMAQLECCSRKSQLGNDAPHYCQMPLAIQVRRRNASPHRPRWGLRRLSRRASGQRSERGRRITLGRGRRGRRSSAGEGVEGRTSKCTSEYATGGVGARMPQPPAPPPPPPGAGLRACSYTAPPGGRRRRRLPRSRLRPPTSASAGGRRMRPERPTPFDSPLVCPAPWRPGA